MNNMISVITVKRMEKSLTYLADTDETCAGHRADHARAEFAAKSIRNVIFKACEGTIAERNAEADTSESYKAAKEREFDEFFKYEAMKNKRATESIVIDTWRSLNSARNKGQVI